MTLGDLSKLNHCQGNLHIRDIGNEHYAVEAKNAQLMSLQNLVSLELNFSRSSKSHRKKEVSRALLSALKPPPGLKSLEIREYIGATIPNWLVTLVNLTRLVLKDFHECKALPPCGKLPSLKVLHIEAMGNLEIVGPEFFGVEFSGSNHTTEVERFSKSFPKLEELCFRDLAKWEEWSGFSYSSSMSLSSDFSYSTPEYLSYSTASPDPELLTYTKASPELFYTPSPEFKYSTTSSSDLTYSTTIMPSLVSMEISNCHKLATVPNFITNVGVLTIENCPILEQRLQKLREEVEWIRISHIPNTRGLQQRLTTHN
ncbi:putative disease resistance protein RGA3 [Humulus lupulus]|uniref:putative disease resistance protein RGA3 n=1 Tax=Humulus lupulus TaxID=3486 RepID=UPI002B414217|nr:putative disease resistance protein RGA3 [Humulus lupulus]